MISPLTKPERRPEALSSGAQRRLRRNSSSHRNFRRSGARRSIRKGV